MHWQHLILDCPGRAEPPFSARGLWPHLLRDWWYLNNIRQTGVKTQNTVADIPALNKALSELACEGKTVQGMRKIRSTAPAEMGQ